MVGCGLLSRYTPVHILAAEVLEIRVFDPAGHQLLIRQIERVLEDRQARHQPCRQRRLAGTVRRSPYAVVERRQLDAPPRQQWAEDFGLASRNRLEPFADEHSPTATLPKLYTAIHGYAQFGSLSFTETFGAHLVPRFGCLYPVIHQ